jgi:hypothetical protein
MAERGRIYDSTKRFVLAELEDGYAIWDLNDPRDEPLATFPGTAEGFAEGESRFKDLKRIARGERDMLFRVLRWVVVVAIGLWMIAGLILQALFQSNFWEGPRGQGLIILRLEALQAAAFNVWLTAAVVLAMLWVERFWRDRPGKP